MMSRFTDGRDVTKGKLEGGGGIGWGRGRWLCIRGSDKPHVCFTGGWKTGDSIRDAIDCTMDYDGTLRFPNPR